MPFKSKAQQRYMFSQHPEIAHRWADEMKTSHRRGAKQHSIKSAALPERVGKVDSAATSTINRVGGAYRGRQSVNEERRAMSDFMGRARRARIPFEAKERASKVALARLARVGKAEEYGQWLVEQQQRGPGMQPTFGRQASVGRRIIEKAAPPKGPAKKAPTIARRGAQQPKASLVPSGSMPTVGTTPLMPQLGTLPGSQVVPMRKAKRVQLERMARPTEEQHDAKHWAGALFTGRKDAGERAGRLYRVRQLQRAAGSNMRVVGKTVGKADRYYDPESKRQRRIGAAGAGSIGAGAAITGSGVRRARWASRGLHNAADAGRKWAEGDHSSGQHQRLLVNLADNTERGAVLLNPKAAVRIGAGAALAGAGARMLVRPGDPRKRRHY